MKFTPHDLKGVNVASNNDYGAVKMRDHPHAQRSGYVQLSRLVMENHLGRYLEPNEIVWHLDENRWNNGIDNLSLEAPRKLADRTCLQCKKTFRCTNARIRHCSPACGQKSLYRCKHPPKEELQRQVWMMPTMHLAKEYGVSDVAVAKWCRKFGALKPPRGYWQKLSAGKDVKSMVPRSIVRFFGGLSGVVAAAV